MALEFPYSHSPEQLKTEPEKRYKEELLEKKEELVIATIELFRTHSVKKINEGNNGVIGSVDPDKLKIFGDLFDGAEDGVALKFLKSLKLLKIGSREAIQREFEAQQLVYKILGSSVETGTCPKPYTHCSFKVTEELKEEFEILGFQGEYADVMFMDLVPGRDLAHIQYEELIKRSIKEYKVKSGMVTRSAIGYFSDMTDEDIENLSFRELHSIVSEVFFEETPNTEEGVRAGIRNANFVTNELGRLGFQVAPQIITRISKSIERLEKEGVYLVDCHDRNIMIKGDVTSEDAEVVFIDFGNVHIQKDSTGNFDYQSADGEVRFVNPRIVSARLEKINTLAKKTRSKLEAQPTVEQRIGGLLQGVQKLFDHNNEKSLGLSESKNKSMNKTPFYEKSIRSALLSVSANNVSITKRELLREYRDISGKKLTIQNDIYASRHLLEATFGLVFSLVSEKKITEEQMNVLVDSLYTSPDFADILTEKKIYSDFQKVNADQIKSIIKDVLKHKES